MEVFTHITNNLVLLMTVIGILAFMVSAITEVTKNISVLKKIPTDLLVIILSAALCLVAYFSYTSYFNIGIQWYCITGCLIAAFIVAFVAMYGWEKLSVLYNRYKKQEGESMAIKIGHASIDERGKISDGKIGDQTGKEICIRSWYLKPWNVYLECTDKALANSAAKFMEQICDNPAYGYDQIERWTGYNNIKKNKNRVSGVGGEFDCSSLVISCYILSGLNISVDGYTGNLKAKLLATGKFKAFTDPAHLTSDKYAKRGGIYLKEGSHVIMALEDGQMPKNPYKEPTETIKLDKAGEGVMWVQWELREAGYTIVMVDGYEKELKIDGDCGTITNAGIRSYQKDHGLVVDGMAGPKTIASLKKVQLF